LPAEDMQDTAARRRALNSMTMAESTGPALKSYLAGHWLSGNGAGSTLVSPADSGAVAWCSTEGVDFGRALAFAHDARRADAFAR
jgi:hypothetical protein